MGCSVNLRVSSQSREIDCDHDDSPSDDDLGVGECEETWKSLLSLWKHLSPVHDDCLMEQNETRGNNPHHKHSLVL